MGCLILFALHRRFLSQIQSWILNPLLTFGCMTSNHIFAVLTFRLSLRPDLYFLLGISISKSKPRIRSPFGLPHLFHLFEPKILKPCQIPSSGLFTSPCLIWSVANSSQIIPFHFSPLLPRLALFLIQTFIFLICTLSYSNLLYQWLQPVLGSLHQIHLWALHIQFIL